MFFFHYFSSKFTGNNCPRLSSSSPDPYYHPRPSIPPCVIQISCRTPSPPIPTNSHPSQAPTATQSPSHPSQDLYIHLWSLYPSQMFHMHPRPSKSISVPPHPPKPLHIHPNPFTHIRSPLYLTKLPIPIPDPPHTHLKPLTPISGPLRPNKTLHTHIRPSILILGLHTITWPFTTTLGPPHQSQALLTHPTPSNPSQTFHITLCHPD